MKNTLVVILGPTGIGKTKISIEIARHFNTEIISADSRQFFREMSIGTAVPANDELDLVKHHFIHHLSITDYYNVSRFEQEVLALLDNLFREKKIVLLTGGSMLYIDAVCLGIDAMPDVDPWIRNRLAERLASEGIESLRLELKNLDPEYYVQADLKNPVRIVHALEICYTTGKPYSSFRNRKSGKRPFDILKIGLNCERIVLFDRIDQRVDMMIASGLLEEVKRLLPLRNLSSLNTVGYKELYGYLDGSTSLEEAIRLIKRNTHRYAKKQLTWFAHDKEIQWFQHTAKEEIISFINEKINEKS